MCVIESVLKCKPGIIKALTSSSISDAEKKCLKEVSKNITEFWSFLSATYSVLKEAKKILRFFDSNHSTLYDVIPKLDTFFAGYILTLEILIY
jgi:hypothetical protein